MTTNRIHVSGTPGESFVKEGLTRNKNFLGGSEVQKPIRSVEDRQNFEPTNHYQEKNRVLYINIRI
jgi:hypothetical protein